MNQPVKKKRLANFTRKSCVVATQIALAMMAVQAAIAQQPPGERIEITGSRIPTPNLESTSPVAVITAQDIKLDGVTRIEDMLNNLPQVFADFGSSISNGATGTATVNLRNLGATRTLVLMNGRRLPIGSPQPFTGSYPPDLNQIPAPLIQRIEVLTGGASAVYGSDAVAGVVNFVMRDNFEGVQGEISHSFYNHRQNNSFASVLAGRAETNPQEFRVPDDVRADGKSTEASLLLGGNFANGKGNATVFFDYKQDKAVLQSQRDFSSCATGVNAAGDAFVCGGSSTNATGRFLSPTGASFTIADAAGTVRAFTAARDQFNFAPYNYFQRPDERYGFNAFTRYDINSHVRAYSEFTYHDSHTLAQIAPSGAFAFQDILLSADNPLLSPSFRNAMGITATEPQIVGVARRNVEGGGRASDLTHVSRRIVLGVKGDVMKHWDYDVFAQHARVTFQQVYRNDFSIARIARALDVVTDPATGMPACRSFVEGTDTACAPWNIFQAGGVTQDALDYVQTPGFQKGATVQRLVGATLSTDLGNYGLKLPSAKNGIGFAAGVERRTEKLEFEADTAFNTGDLAGQGGPTQDLAGQFTVRDYFAEVRLPILEGRRMAELLSVNGSYRFSDYSTGKETSSYGLGIEWAPNRNVKARGSYQQAVRAANLIEMFAAQGPGLFNMGADPCGTDPVTQPTPTASLAECQRSGITATNYGSPVLISPAGQYQATFGGNADLEPEKAKTYTAGIVLTPMRNLSATIDYFNIEVDKVIGTLPSALVVNQCVFSGQFCDLVFRDARGTLWAVPNPTEATGGYVVATNQNLGKLKTSGLDVAINYNHQMGGLGTLGVGFLGTYLNELKTEPIPGLGEYDCRGLYGTTCGTPIPKWRHKLRASWGTPWRNLDLALTWRHIDKVKIDASSSDELLAGAFADVGSELGARNYLDIAFSLPITRKITLRGGVNNVFDRDPPLGDSAGAVGAPYGNGNTYPQVYDALGRKIFLSVTVGL